jgi:uncharacterized protein (TIGR02145 family)
MKKILLLLALVLATTLVLAQHKTMTIYHSSGSTDVVNLSSTDSIVIFICGASKVNYGGKYYNTVLIGNQCWLKENLDIGTRINGSLNQTNNSTIEKYCYDDVPSNCITYGGLYQWNEAMQFITTEGAKGICPTGWHIPRQSEFEILASTVIWNSNALKREDQGFGGGQGTNTSGFSALLAGYRDYTGGNFSALGSHGRFWSSTVSDASNAYDLLLVSSNGSINLHSNYKDYGFSVRCIKD